ncbi:MAG TPA: hypothetical protein VG759_22220 [Candidatus Angelobacter sp.]|jgi:hypothetical protein|nr:hypothetical protein [Candidatus Angelobacter sp.]
MSRKETAEALICKIGRLTDEMLPKLKQNEKEVLVKGIFDLIERWIEADDTERPATLEHCITRVLGAMQRQEQQQAA